MATAADLIVSMDANGIDRAVTFGFGWGDPGIIRLANDAVIAFIATTLDIPRRQVQIVSGATARHKRVAITGVSLADLHAKITADQE